MLDCMCCRRFLSACRITRLGILKLVLGSLRFLPQKMVLVQATNLFGSKVVKLLSTHFKIWRSKKGEILSGAYPQLPSTAVCVYFFSMIRNALTQRRKQYDRKTYAVFFNMIQNETKALNPTKVFKLHS